MLDVFLTDEDDAAAGLLHLGHWALLKTLPYFGGGRKVLSRLVTGVEDDLLAVSFLMSQYLLIKTHKNI